MFQDFADNLPVILKQLMALLLVPLRAPLDQGTLLHWPFLLSALTIALLATRFAPGALHFLKVYFSRAVWWHPSARADYLYYLINGAFFPVIFAPLLAVSAIVSSATVDMFNAPSGSGEAHWIIVTAFSLAVFVAYDFGRYIGHWVQHKNAVLWEFHKVHHSAEVLTPLTSFRLHPVDLLLMSAVPGFFTGLVGGECHHCNRWRDYTLASSGYAWRHCGLSPDQQLAPYSCLGFLWTRLVTIFYQPRPAPNSSQR
ncbi:MAG: sterol desaturase family protein [Alphaproteobacteria bacterium]|nr:sterol desaturase family protein [Alphaproteobacteria bacterium]